MATNKHKKNNSTVLVGGDFTRANYSLSPLAEDVKNGVTSILQCVTSGMKSGSITSIEALEEGVFIPTPYGEASILKEKVLHKGLKSNFRFTVPLKYFWGNKGGKPSGKDYQNLIAAFESLKNEDFSYTESDSEKELLLSSHFILQYEILRSKDTPDQDKTLVSFVINSQVISWMFDARKGISKFQEDLCRRLKSFYSKRFFEIFSSLSSGNSLNFKESTLRSMFRLEDKYKNNCHFQKKVIDQAIQELNTENLFDLKVTVTGRGEDRQYCFDMVHNRLLSSDKSLVHKYSNVLEVKAEVINFLERVVGMTSQEIEAHKLLLDKFSKVDDAVAVLTDRWELANIAIPPEKYEQCNSVRNRRIGYMINTIRGYLDDISAKK